MGQSLKSKAPNIHYSIYSVQANKKYSHQDYYLVKSLFIQKQWHFVALHKGGKSLKALPKSAKMIVCIDVFQAISMLNFIENNFLG